MTIKRLLTATLTVGLGVWLQLATGARAQSVVPTSASLLADALAAERESRFTAAIDQLYRLVGEHPQSNEALRGRLVLAQLLALSGDLGAALLQCQAVQNAYAPGTPERDEAVALGTTLVRQLRAQSAGRGYFPSVSATMLSARDRFDEPSVLLVGEDGGLVIADRGRKRIYGVQGSTLSTIATANNPTAATWLADGTLAIADRQGLVLGSSRSALSAMWEGRARELDNVRAIAENSRGELFVADGDIDGVVKCAGGAVSCQAWGPHEEARTLKVGLADLVFILDDGDPIVRVYNADGRHVATVGPQIGGVRLREVRDFSLDAAFGVYLVDSDTKTVQVARLSLMPDGRLVARPVASVRVPESESRGLERPSAIGVAADGSVVLAGRSSLTLLRLQ